MRYELARDSDACAGGLRDSAIRTRSLRCIAVTVALFLVFMLLPTHAYAAGQVSEWSRVWFHSSVDAGEQYIVGAYNKFDAAAYICGYTKQQVSSWDLAVLNRLSTQNTAFLTLANSLENVTPWNDDSLQDSLEEYFGDPVWFDMGMISIGTSGVGVNLNGVNSWQVKYWEMSKPSDMPVWAVNTTAADVGAAKEALRQILDGGGSGGGSGAQPEIDGNTIVFNCVTLPNQINNAQNDVYVDGHGWYTFENSPNNTSSTYLSGLRFSLTFRGDSNYAVREGYDYVMVLRGNGFYVLAFEHGSYTTEVVDVTDAFGRGTYQIVRVTTTRPYYGNPNSSQSSYNRSIVNGQLECTSTGYIGVNFDSPHDAGVVNLPGDVYSQWSTVRAGCISTNFVSSGGGGTEGPGDWPSDPSPEPPESPTVPTPTPPQLPTPYNPIVPPTVPTDPITNVTDPTSWTDYTPWLQKILQQLRNLNDEIGEHCVHIQQQIVDQATNLINALNTANESMKDYLYELQRGLTGYLKQLFDWLADQMDFEVNPYNDSSVLYWLRQIYTRLGKLIRTNVPTVLEPDPTEPFDFWAWLWGLITNVIGGFIGDFVGDVGGLIDGIKDKFPFSIPWDIAAMLALLDANRVTPVFVVNIPAVNGWWACYSYRIDLQPFDSVAAACRAMFNIVWSFVLIMKTNWMLMIMGDSTSLGERFANRVGRGTE